MSQFFLPSTSPSNTAASTPAPYDTSANLSGSEDDSSLPFPTELPRSAFLTPHFDPSTYLSTLRNRHQTLEDLRTDLRSRSQLLTKELLDLVNGNYEEFLSLGGDLRGGEEKVEEVRVGLLAFQREVETLRKSVLVRAEEVRELVGERKSIRRQVALGRSLLEVEAKIGELEDDLGVTPGVEDDDEDEEDELESVNANGIPVGRPRRHADQYLLVGQVIGHIGPAHPFLVAQSPRLAELKKTMLLDLAAALRQAKAAKDPDAVLAIVRIYGDLDAQAEGVRALKGG